MASPPITRLSGGNLASRFDDEEKPPAKVLPLPKKPAQPESPYPFTWVSEAKLVLDTKPIIKGLIDPGSFVVVYGPSGSGKSFFTADMAQHIATGQAWRGKRTPPGLVVYVASEAGSSILKRFVGWRENRLGESAEKIPLAVITRGPNLLNGVDVEKLNDQLAHLQEIAEMPVALVIFDTLSRSIPGGDENSAEDMTMAVNAADYLRQKFNCATAYVHHTGKDPEKGARGHSALFAAADLVLKVADHCATVEKIRDGVAGEKFAFELEPVEIGTDADGDPVMTCLLNPADGAGKPKERTPTGRNQKIIYAPLKAFFAEHAERSPGTSAIPKGAATVSMAELIEYCLPKFGDDVKGFRAREKIKDAIMGLQAAGFIGVHGDIVWMA